MKLTPQGILCLALAMALYLAALTSQSSLLLLLDGILLGAGLMNFAAARRALRELEIAPPVRTRVVEGHPPSQPWNFTNHGRGWTGLVEVGLPTAVWVRLDVLGPKASAHRLPEVRFARRGVFRLSGLQARSRWPFGLVVCAKPLALPGEVVVVPAIYPADPPQAAGYDVMVGGRHHGRRRTASGSEFAGVRPFQTGDPIKHIHWKASGKGQGLMVKTFDEELSGRVAILTLAGPTADALRDDSIRAAGSLIFAALDQGHHVEWQDSASAELVLIPPFADGDDILDRLARVPSGDETPTAARLNDLVSRFSRRSALSIVTPAEDADLTRCTEQWTAAGRAVTWYLPATRAAASAPVPTHYYAADRLLPPQPAL